jgi:hypothetical protein
MILYECEKWWSRGKRLEHIPVTSSSANGHVCALFIHKSRVCPFFFSFPFFFRYVIIISERTWYIFVLANTEDWWHHILCSDRYKYRWITLSHLLICRRNAMVIIHVTLIYCLSFCLVKLVDRHIFQTWKNDDFVFFPFILVIIQ